MSFQSKSKGTRTRRASGLSSSLKAGRLKTQEEAVCFCSDIKAGGEGGAGRQTSVLAQQS